MGGLSYVAVACIMSVIRRVPTGAGARTSEVLQELDFAQCPLGQDLLAEHIGDLLDGHALARLAVGRSTT